MKRCPQCGTTYTDDTLRFCLADGAVLSEVGEDETAIRPGVRVDIEQPRSASAPFPGQHHQPRKSGSTAIKVFAAVLVLGFLALVAVGGAGVLYYLNSGGSPTVARTTPTETPRPTPSASPSPDPDQERLEKELANVLKKLEDELGSDSNSSTPSPAQDGRPTARVNSPNDGFLALRAEPDAENGERIAKIPHGSTVTLENCEKQKTTVAGRTGRWCMVTYQGETGWVFDAWLKY